MPDEFGEPVIRDDIDFSNSNIDSVSVGAKGLEMPFARRDLTLHDKYTFSCNPVTNEVETFTDNSAAGCMDICHETVKKLRSLPSIMEAEETNTYQPFYIAMGVIVPLFFLLCLASTEKFMPALVLSCKVFDWMSDWAFYAVSLHSPQFTEQSSFGSFRNNTYEDIQRASLAFCILGTFLVVSEWYGIGFVQKDTELWGMNNHQIRANIGIFVILFEDIPQLVLCGVYLKGMHSDDSATGSTRDGYQFSDDTLTGLSIVLSSISFVYNVVTVVRQRLKGSKKESNGGEETFDGFDTLAEETFDGFKEHCCCGQSVTQSSQLDTYRGALEI